jgi:DNA-binding NtrC family response regulator
MSCVQQRRAAHADTRRCAEVRRDASGIGMVELSGRRSAEQPGRRGRVLLVEDDRDFARLVVDTLAEPPLHLGVRIATDREQAARLLGEERFDLVLLDRGLPDGDGLDLLQDQPVHDLAVPVLVLTADATAASAVAALRAGAVDYLVKSAGALERLATLAPALLAPSRPAHDVRGAAALVGETPVMHGVRELVRRYARSRAPVLVEGETGVGKELVARALHVESERASGPFVAINCGALPEHLVESELFGHVRGAFTGAHRDHGGLVEHAERGTLFLDEIEDLPPSLQGKLLRLLQESEYRPVGATRARRADVRVVAASNADLHAMVRDRRFRRDLFYRLDVLRIVVPPLRQRLDDLPLLLAHLARGVVGRAERRFAAAFVPPSALQLQRLWAHPWPGNVRELGNLVERAGVVAASVGWPAGWATAVGQLERGEATPRSRAAAPLASAADARPRPGRDALLDLLERHRWRRAAAARELGISRVTLWRRMRRHGLTDASEASEASEPSMQGAEDGAEDGADEA